MNSVATDGISDEDTVEISRARNAEHGFRPPLDVVDETARIVDPIIVDPIIDGPNTGRPVWGGSPEDCAPTDR